MSDPHRIKLNAWDDPIVHLCPICAAMLLDQDGVEKHAAWHAHLDECFKWAAGNP
jgi:hypothetical protein